MRIRRKSAWLGAFIAGTFIFTAVPLPAQSPDPPADSLAQLRDMRVMRTPAGREAFMRYCAFCHGNEGRGDGLNAFNLKIRPRDFADTAAMKGKTKSSVENVIRKGGAANQLSPDMPPWGRTLDPAAVERLAAYVLGVRPDGVSK